MYPTISPSAVEAESDYPKGGNEQEVIFRGTCVDCDFTRHPLVLAYYCRHSIKYVPWIQGLRTRELCRLWEIFVPFRGYVYSLNPAPHSTPH